MPLEAVPRNWAEIPEESAINNLEQIFMVKQVGSPPEGRFRRIQMGKITGQFQTQLKQMVDDEFLLIKNLIIPQSGSIVPISSTSGAIINSASSYLRWHKIMNRVFITGNVNWSTIPSNSMMLRMTNLPFPPFKSSAYFFAVASQKIFSILITLPNSTYPTGEIVTSLADMSNVPTTLGSLSFECSYEISV